MNHYLCSYKKHSIVIAAADAETAREKAAARWRVPAFKVSDITVELQ